MFDSGSSDSELINRKCTPGLKLEPRGAGTPIGTTAFAPTATREKDHTAYEIANRVTFVVTDYTPSLIWMETKVF